MPTVSDTASSVVVDEKIYAIGVEVQVFLSLTCKQSSSGVGKTGCCLVL